MTGSLRHDLAALQQQDPDLATVLERARAVLNSTPHGPVDGPDASAAGDPDQIRAAERQMLEERRQAARQWDAAVEQVRQLKGDFEHFLRPVPFTELRPAAAGGPVVIVNVSPQGSHALIVVPETGSVSHPGAGPGVQVVDLPAAPWTPSSTRPTPCWPPEAGPATPPWTP